MGLEQQELIAHPHSITGGDVNDEIILQARQDRTTLYQGDLGHNRVRLFLWAPEDV